MFPFIMKRYRDAITDFQEVVFKVRLWLVVY